MTLLGIPRINYVNVNVFKCISFYSQGAICSYETYKTGRDKGFSDNPFVCPELPSSEHVVDVQGLYRRSPSDASQTEVINQNLIDTSHNVKQHGSRHFFGRLTMNPIYTFLVL